MILMCILQCYLDINLNVSIRAMSVCQNLNLQFTKQIKWFACLHTVSICLASVKFCCLSNGIERKSSYQKYKGIGSLNITEERTNGLRFDSFPRRHWMWGWNMEFSCYVYIRALSLHGRVNTQMHYVLALKSEIYLERKWCINSGNKIHDFNDFHAIQLISPSTIW